jgi:hypothetical protein
MDGSQIDALVHRLVANPHDEQALAAAHQAGTADPKSYAMFLERVGTQSQDPAYASHWLSEAANVWSTTLGDAHRAARALMQAIDRDPTQRTAAERLAELYRQKGDVKALVALLEVRAKALTPLAPQSDEVRAELGSIHEELGRLWGESLQQPKKALDHFRRAVECDSRNVYAVYGAREIHKSLGQWREAFELYEAELAFERDPARRVALLRDEAAARRAAGDLRGASLAIANARESDPLDAALQQEYASTIIERIAGGEAVSAQERTVGAELLVGLAEAYDGEHGLAYSSGALDIDPGHDRAMQLYAYYARALQREGDVSSRYLAYIQTNPNGALAAEARWSLAASYEAAGQTNEAIGVLEPMGVAGDPQATAHLRELYALTGHSAPPAMVTPPGPVPPAPSVTAAAHPPPPPRPLSAIEKAQSLATAGKRDEAYAAYLGVLERDPAQAEALSWVEDYLRTTREYRALRDVLLAAARATGSPVDWRQQKLREVAALSEGNLRDPGGAIEAWKQLLLLDRGDEVARQSLTRALEKSQRWDDLAELLEHQAAQESDLEKKIALEKRLAALHEHKRHDFAKAAEAWEHIAHLTPEDDDAIVTASLLYERAGTFERAAQVIAASASGVDDLVARATLLERLGQLRERLQDAAGAGEAYSEAAAAQPSARLWDAAERCLVTAGEWERAGLATNHRSELEPTPNAKGRHLARAADHFARAGDENAVIENLAKATELDPSSDEFATRLAERYTVAARWPELVALFSMRGDRIPDVEKRVAARREAARLLTSRLADKQAASDTWRKVLEDGDDKEALERLVDDAVEREDYEEATQMLRRLEKIAAEGPERARIALREAELVADGLGDVDTAVARYERILAELDSSSRPALQAIADLQEARDMPAAAANALERELTLVEGGAERGPIASRLARLYEQLDDLPNAIRVLEVVRTSDPDDFDALGRLCELCEKTKEWAKLAELLAQRIDVEADDGEISQLTTKLARLLADELDRGDEALAVLTELADGGDDGIRKTYVELGDRLGWRGIVAGKLVEWWFGAKPSPERTPFLRGAFERFAEVGRDEEAVRVGCEIVRSRGGDLDLGRHLEALAVKMRDLDAISTAHDLLVRDLTGGARAEELVRQAEVRLKAGAPRLEALHHGELGLTSIPPAKAEELLQRLAAIAEVATDVIDLYERQIGRCKTPSDRVAALARAAQVAGAFEHMDRARALFDLALSGTPTDDAVKTLEEAAREADAHIDGNRMRHELSVSMSSGGQGARDGGRTRGTLLRRAASIAHGELGDDDQAFAWLGDALVAHVEAPTLDMLDGLARELRAPERAEATLSRALLDVFDGPLVRQLLARRARLRRDDLKDKAGAASDLKKLYELGPGEPSVVDELATLLTEIGDHRSRVQLYEDQILRGKEVHDRADLARRVAGMWESELADPREAADAWRRVLRMKPGDAEAVAGLERAKANMLRRPAPSVSSDDVEPTARAETSPGVSAVTPEAAAGGSEPAGSEESPGGSGVTRDARSGSEPAQTRDAVEPADSAGVLPQGPDAEGARSTFEDRAATIGIADSADERKRPQRAGDRDMETEPSGVSSTSPASLDDDSHDPANAIPIAVEQALAPDVAPLVDTQASPDSANSAHDPSAALIHPIEAAHAGALAIDAEEAVAADAEQAVAADAEQAVAANAEEAVTADAEEDVVIADDFAEIIDDEDEVVAVEAEAAAKKEPSRPAKRSVPPPLPRT